MDFPDILIALTAVLLVLVGLAVVVLQMWADR